MVFSAANQSGKKLLSFLTLLGAEFVELVTVRKMERKEYTFSEIVGSSISQYIVFG